MIYVDRSIEPPPPVLLDKVLKMGGAYETEQAIAFYKLAKNRGKPFPYKAYSDPAVKAALEKLFNKKCAYCESEYMHLHPTEVEHWRPKGEVETEKKEKIKPGYYWLAAQWNNLLPSCIDCNRQRYHKVGSGNGEPVLLGKKNSFPLEPGSPRATKPDQEKKEKPLLLHPCEDKPLEFLAFPEEEERRGIISARVDAPKERAAKAEASIHVYALNRPELVWTRKQRYIDIQAQIKRVEEAAVRLKNPPDEDTRKRETEIYEREMNTLLSFQGSIKPYSLMAGQIISKFLASRM